MSKEKANLQLKAPLWVQALCLEDIYIPQAFRQKPQKKTDEYVLGILEDEKPATDESAAKK